MGDFNVVIWKVEHGSAAFVQTPNDRMVMLDAGCSDSFSPAKYLHEKYAVGKSDTRLDKLIISHPDRDHIADLPNAYSLLSPKIFSRCRGISDNEKYPNGTHNLNEPLLTYYNMEQTYNAELSPEDKNSPTFNWGGVWIETYTADRKYLAEAGHAHLKNNLSLLTVVRYGQIEIVFPGDLEPPGWEALLDSTNVASDVGKSDLRVLVASHHGRESGIRNQDGSVYDRFLAEMRPHLVIISDIWGNETTDPDAYRPHTLGAKVFHSETEESKDADVLTTKTNKFVLVYSSDTGSGVAVP